MITDNRDKTIRLLNLSDTGTEKMDAYVSLLEEWQSKMNLVSSSSLPDVWNRHVLDSGQLYKYIKDSDKTIFDFGSGAGFPALVLAIMDEGKNRKFHLVESDGKKCSFLETVIKECQLNAVVHNKRIEKISVPSADLITARALAALDKLLAYALPYMSEKTRCLFLKGKKAPEEIKAAEKKWSFKKTIHLSLSGEEGRILELSEVKKK